MTKSPREIPGNENVEIDLSLVPLQDRQDALLMTDSHYTTFHRNTLKHAVMCAIDPGPQILEMSMAQQAGRASHVAAVMCQKTAEDRMLLAFATVAAERIDRTTPDVLLQEVSNYLLADMAKICVTLEERFARDSRYHPVIILASRSYYRCYVALGKYYEKQRNTKFRRRLISKDPVHTCKMM